MCLRPFVYSLSSQHSDSFAHCSHSPTMFYLLVPVIAACYWLFSWCYLLITQDAREPPVVPHAIPYIGHLIQLLRFGSSYYGMIRSVTIPVDDRRTENSGPRTVRSKMFQCLHFACLGKRYTSLHRLKWWQQWILTPRRYRSARWRLNSRNESQRPVKRRVTS